MKTLMITLFAIAAAANMALAGDKPDFSGNWKLDLEKSSFGPLPPPASMIRTIDQKGPDITMQQAMTGPDMNVTLKYSTAGKETANSFMGMDFKSKANWDGKVLLIHNVVDAGGESTDKWTLSDDGKTFTDVLSISSPDGKIEIAHVLIRQ
jgi:hypothetical protein